MLKLYQLLHKVIEKVRKQRRFLIITQIIYHSCMYFLMYIIHILVKSPKLERLSSKIAKFIRFIIINLKLKLILF